jgi:hypothetical protein
MTDATVSTALSIGVPTLAVLLSTLINNSRINDVNSRISDLRAHLDTRFDDMREMWRSELRRVEEVLDARLKHLEERAR